MATNGEREIPNHGLLGTSLTRRPRGRTFGHEDEMIEAIIGIYLLAQGRVRVRP
jgi:hypothetical protein